MDLASIPFFQIIQSRMKFLEARQQAIAENIANADTPAYKARDVSESEFARLIEHGAGGQRPPSGGLRTTHARHIAPLADAGPFKFVDAPDRETAPSGNTVVLEDQMFKMSDTQMTHQAAVNLYRKGVELLRLAVRGG